MCWRNGIWHPCVKIASPANTFAIISSVQRGVAQAALRPPYGARRQHLHEGWAGEGKLQLLWLAFLQGLLHYHNVVREHDGCGVGWHLWCEGEVLGVSAWAFNCDFLSVFLFLLLSFILFFLWVFFEDCFFFSFFPTVSPCVLHRVICVCWHVRISKQAREASVSFSQICRDLLQADVHENPPQPRPPGCVCVHLHPAFSLLQHTCAHSRRMHVCVCVCITPIHSDPLCDFCHFKHPLLQRSVTEHLLYSTLLMSDPPERGGMGSRRRRRISWVFIFSLALPPVPC